MVATSINISSIVDRDSEWSRAFQSRGVSVMLTVRSRRSSFT